MLTLVWKQSKNAGRCFLAGMSQDVQETWQKPDVMYKRSSTSQNEAHLKLKVKFQATFPLRHFIQVMWHSEAAAVISQNNRLRHD
jgi:hypothetical protein